jgi:tRNA(Ile)-lysidine synthase
MKLFNAQPVPIQRRVLRHWGRKTQPSVALEFKHIEQIRELVSEKSNESREGRQVELPGRWRAIRKGHYLELATSDLSPSDRSDVLGEYQYAFTVPGTITVRELGIALEAISIPPNPSTHGYNPDQLLDPSFLGQELTVRSWRPGDRFWPAHTKAPKKIKELLQEKHLDVNERKLWPVLASRSKIVWVLGFAVPVEFQARQGEEALLIRKIEGINKESYKQSTG